MVALDIKVDTKGLEKALHNLAAEARVAPGLVIKEETKALVRNIMQLTPPKTYAQGRAAVASDMRKIAIPMNDEFTTGDLGLEGENSWKARMKEAVAARDHVAIEALMRNSKHRFWRGRSVVQSQGNLAQLHRGNRSPRGRTYSLRNVAYGGDWKAHVKTVQERVGWAKSGWVAMADKVGLRTPGWLRRLAGISGSAQAQFGTNPGVYAVNYNVKIPNYQQVVSAAVRNRWRVTEKKILRIIQGKATNLGFTTIG
jgi:hypothetical protein